VFVDSAIGQGTTFRLYFPPAAPLVARPPAPADAAEPARSRHGAETVMIVEDETAVRNFVASALRDEGYQLLLAGSAEEAENVSGAHSGEIDLLLTDAIMPGKSGIELASAMVAERPGLPVIIMSGYTRESLSVRGLAEPVNLLRKPFTPTELRSRIRAALGHASS
jgi:DNA-binding response OmpR family regulator